MTIETILNKVLQKEIDIKEAESLLKELTVKDIDYAKIDFDREKRTGFCEVIYCQGKNIDHIVGIVQEMSKRIKTTILLTRATQEIYLRVKEVTLQCEFFKDARIIVLNGFPPVKNQGKIAILTAGTADIAVAEEAAITLTALGNQVDRIYDVGVAGLHRLLRQIDRINEAKILIVIAGMEGALASVVGGLTKKPVIAVPTSVGYGANFEGLSALLTMINSCAAGISVVNIDNGFGAAMFADRINNI